MGENELAQTRSEFLEFGTRLHVYECLGIRGASLLRRPLTDFCCGHCRLLASRVK